MLWQFNWKLENMITLWFILATAFLNKIEGIPVDEGASTSRSRAVLEETERRELDDQEKIALHKLAKELYKRGEYEEAISCLTEALRKFPNSSTFITDRGRCYFRMEKLDLAKLDFERALDMVPNNARANFYLGRTLLVSGDCSEAVKYLEIALKLGQESGLKNSTVDGLRHGIDKIRKRKRDDEEARRRLDEDEFLGSLEILLNEKITRMKEEGGNDGADLVKAKCEKYQNMFKSIVAESDAKRRKIDNHEIPAYLCDPITLDILKDPVITPTGITYDRESISKHLQEVGNFDPTTRQELTVEQLIPNYVMKDVLRSFLESNPWATSSSK